MNRRTSVDEWVSTIARIVGLIGLITFGLVWGFTGRIEPVLVMMSGGLYGIGQFGAAIGELRRPPEKGAE